MAKVQASSVPTAAKLRLDAATPARNTATAAGSTWLINSVEFLDRPALPYSSGASWIDEDALFQGQPGQVQWIDGSGPVHIGGAVRSGEGLDLYRVGPGAAAYRVSVDNADSSKQWADRLSLFDESGQLVGEWTMPPEAAGISLEIRTSDGLTLQDFIIGIGPSTNDFDPGDESYILQIEPIPWDGTAPPQEPAPTPTPRPDPGPSAPGSDHIPSPTPSPDDGFESGPPGEAGEPDVIAGPSPTGSEVKVTGPLPSRTAAPFGGVLASGHPLPEASIDDGVGLDVMLVDLFLAQLEAAPDGVSTPTDDRGLVEILAESGMPIVAASYPRPAAQDPPFDSTLFVAEPEELTAGAALAMDALETTPTQDQGEPKRALPIALGLVTALAVTLTLPEFSPIPHGRHSQLSRWWRRCLSVLRMRRGYRARLSRLRTPPH